MVIFCDSESMSRFCNWYNGSEYTHRQVVLIGRTEKSCDEIIREMFSPETEEYKERLRRAGYALEESQVWENGVKKRIFRKTLRQKMFFLRAKYSETYTIDQNRKERNSIIIHSTVKLFWFLPYLTAVSKLYMKTENGLTDIYYCYEKTLSSFLLSPISRTVMRRIITMLHLYALDSEISLFRLPDGLINFLSVNLVMGIVAVIAASSVFSKIVRIFLNI